MNHRALASTVIAASIAFAKPVIFVAQGTRRAAEVLAEARKAIGGHALESMKTFSVQSAVQRNVGPVQIGSEDRSGDESRLLSARFDTRKYGTASVDSAVATANAAEKP